MKNGAIKNDTGKAPLHLIAPEFLLAMARILGHGDRKYGEANWMRDLGYSRLTAAALRHMNAFQMGEDSDPETGESHLVHAACSLMMLHHYQNNEGFTDDRRYKNMPGVQETEGIAGIHPESDQKIGLGVSHMLQHEEDSNAERVDPVRRLQDRIKAWADSVFPERTAHNALCKLVMEEIPELLNGGLDDPMEYADVLILILDVASLRGIDAIGAAHEKMAVNEGRSWVKDPATGLMHHKDE